MPWEASEVESSHKRQTSGNLQRDTESLNKLSARHYWERWPMEIYFPPGLSKSNPSQVMCRLLQAKLLENLRSCIFVPSKQNNVSLLFMPFVRKCVPSKISEPHLSNLIFRMLQNVRSLWTMMHRNTKAQKTNITLFVPPPLSSFSMFYSTHFIFPWDLPSVCVNWVGVYAVLPWHQICHSHFGTGRDRSRDRVIICVSSGPGGGRLLTSGISADLFNIIWGFFCRDV